MATEIRIERNRERLVPEQSNADWPLVTPKNSKEHISSFCLPVIGEVWSRQHQEYLADETLQASNAHNCSTVMSMCSHAVTRASSSIGSTAPRFQADPCLQTTETIVYCGIEMKQLTGIMSSYLVSKLPTNGCLIPCQG